MEQRSASAMVPIDDEIGRRAIARVRRRLIPFMFLLFIVAYLDRINNVGGFVGASLVGIAREATNSFAGGLFVIAAALLGAAAVALTVPDRRE